ncbi:MAG TPA: hypothetical protein VGF04_04245 [Solirubrobacterales bacterium]|jgi:hypothetical protein
MTTTGEPAEKPKARTASLAAGTIVSSSATPYGYTVSLWSTGALLLHSHSTPAPWEVFLFAAGAVLAFTLIGLIAHGRMWAVSPLPHGPETLVAGILHWFAVGAAVGAAALVALIPGWVAWPLASLSATLMYLIGASAQLALVASRKG